jgi:tRNA (cmo5U34)-methyltransferase
LEAGILRDELFREPLSLTAGFEFNKEVAEVFDDMLHRSIPCYAETRAMILELVGNFYIRGSTVYDLGCSTGIMIHALTEQLPGIARIVGVDNSQPMIEKARQRLARVDTKTEIDLRCADLRDLPIERASVVIMNYTLQFIRPLNRPRVLKHIFDGLEPGGAFILSEKVIEESNATTQLFIDMYYRFKRRQGYTELEISRKRERLENVLVPFEVDEQLRILREAGFSDCGIFFKWHNFASFVAIKKPE